MSRMNGQSRLMASAGEPNEDCPTAVAFVQRLRLSRKDRRLWPQIAHLFPEFELDDVGSAARNHAARNHAIRAALLQSGATRARGLGFFPRFCFIPRFCFKPGLLRGPPFTPAAPWVSGQVTAGMDQPVCIKAAREPPNPAMLTRAMALAGQAARLQVGGPFWARPLPDGPEKIMLRPSRPDVVRGLVERLQREHAADQLLLLADHLPLTLRGWLRRAGVAVVGAAVDPWSVLARARALYVDGDDPLAILGILTGRPVHCLTQGVAAGWGLAVGETPGSRSVAEFAAAVLLEGVRYGDPRTGQVIDSEAALTLLGEWRELTQKNREVGCCVGVSFWKRTRLAAFFHDGEQTPPFRQSTSAALAAAGGRAVAAWNSRIPAGLEARLSAQGGRLIRVEDGFIRSRGLGSGFLPPASIIADAHGIYYDPRQASDLELILANTCFDAALQARAAALIDQINRRGITKYGVSGGEFRLGAADGVRRILVPGQVADDLSVVLGSGQVRSNLALLEQVRAANPHAWLVFKPHPDVEAGHRDGAVAERDLRRYADQVARNVPMPAVIAAVDEVHTMTSLAGFEALLRGRAVTVLGQPFYAGWGLTTDLTPLPRRTRRLLLEELAAGVLILYPRYFDPQSGLPCGPELLLDRLEQPELWRASWLMRLRKIHGDMKLRLQTR